MRRSPGCRRVSRCRSSWSARPTERSSSRSTTSAVCAPGPTSSRSATARTSSRGERLRKRGGAVEASFIGPRLADGVDGARMIFRLPPASVPPTLPASAPNEPDPTFGVLLGEVRRTPQADEIELSALARGERRAGALARRGERARLSSAFHRRRGERRPRASVTLPSAPARRRRRPGRSSRRSRASPLPRSLR